jgi:hypothetical protein
MPATVALDELEQALYWVSSPPEYECTAHISRSSGRIFSCGSDGPLDSDAPDDLDDGTQYVALPHKNDLELGRTMVFRFVDEFAPHLTDEVHKLFRQRGAYARFKALLQRHRMLDLWHEHERRATLQALEDWATEHGFIVERGDAA